MVQYNTAIDDETGQAPVHQEPFVFPHEFAHVLGTNHNSEDATNNTTPLEPWAYGHWAAHVKGGGLRTIMSYHRSTCTSPCIRIPYYSNPDITYDWFHTGATGSTNNAQTIADYASYAAQYRANLDRIFYDGFDDYSP